MKGKVYRRKSYKLLKEESGIRAACGIQIQGEDLLFKEDALESLMEVLLPITLGGIRSWREIYI